MFTKDDFNYLNHYNNVETSGYYWIRIITWSYTIIGIRQEYLKLYIIIIIMSCR